MNIFRNRAILKNTSVINALKKMDAIDRKLLIIIDEEEHFVGILSAGDIQRAIIQNKPLDTYVGDILRQHIKLATPEDSFDSIKKLMIEYRMEFCPVVSSSNEILEIYYWEDIFEKKRLLPHTQLTFPVVIMAGGFGTRLKPLTNILPKPLIPIGEKTMIEEIIDRFTFMGEMNFIYQ
jgi:CBS domain-containing protein